MEKNVKNEEALKQEIFTPEEARCLNDIMKDFMAAYAQNQDKEVEEWLPQKIQSSLGVSLEGAQAITKQLVDTIKYNEESARSLAEAKIRGMTREAWVSKVVLEEVKDLPPEEQQQRLGEMYETLVEANGFALDNSETGE